MSHQSYKNHIRFYPPHHFVLLPLILLLIGCTAYGAIRYQEDRLLWLTATALSVVALFIALLMRQHYALGNQDRIVRLEMRLRYYQLTGERLEAYEGRLSKGQIAALRFASDGELPALLQRALTEHLSPDAIKRSITEWQADEMRR